MFFVLGTSDKLKTVDKIFGYWKNGELEKTFENQQSAKNYEKEMLKEEEVKKELVSKEEIEDKIGGDEVGSDEVFCN